MKSYQNKVLTFFCILIFLAISLSPIVSSNKIKNFENIYPQSYSEEIELDLLHGEYYLFYNATEDVTSFNLKYSFPPIYGNQTPIILEIINDDTTAEILSYKIENDTNEPNKFVNFTLGQINKDEQKILHFNYWILVKNYNYSNLPNSITIPKKDELPSETKKWLSSTEIVQSDYLRIRIRAKITKLLTDNILKLANRIAFFSKWHRFGLFYIQYRLGLYGPQDALTALKRNGECPGRSHLGVALFRANDVPARVILAAPSYNFWYEMHFMTEYYSGSKFGWILTEVHQAKTPFEPKNQIIMRICYPEDENNTQTDFINPRMTGVERWFWIDNENIIPYYKDLKDGSRTRMIHENELIVEKMPGKDAVDITKIVFQKYEYYLSVDLAGQNLQFFQNAVDNQMKAIDELKNSNDAYGYIYWMGKANENYDNIVLDD